MSEYLDVPRRWSSLAINATTNESDVDRALSHALEWSYEGVQFDITKGASSNRSLIVREVIAAQAMNQAGVSVLFRVAATEAFEFITKDVLDEIYWNIVIQPPTDSVLLQTVSKLVKSSSKRVLTLKMQPGSEIEVSLGILQTLKELGHDSLHVEFPFAAHRSWQEKEIVQWISKFEAEAGVRVLPPLAWGLEDPDLSADDQILPNPEIILRQNETTHPRLSVTIPTFERTVEVTNTVRHLLRQRIPFENFELIIVDCGSHDTTVRDLEKLITSEGRTTATTIIKIARPVRRRRGESHYRAGLARNVGVARSRGQYLLFLDDNVLLPNDYLQSTLNALENSSETVFVGRCHTLTPENFGVRMNYEKIDCAVDTESPDRGFWRDFYDRQSEWMKLPRPWRFLSTHTLTLSRENFVRTGWFRENFIAYAFEDMELGFRLSKLGAQFQILPIDVYRQNRGSLPETGRTRLARHRVLSRAAQVFYRHTLNQDVFKQVRQLFRQPLWFWLWYDRVRTGGPLWRFRRRKFD